MLNNFNISKTCTFVHNPNAKLPYDLSFCNTKW